MSFNFGGVLGEIQADCVGDAAWHAVQFRSPSSCSPASADPAAGAADAGADAAAAIAANSGTNETYRILRMMCLAAMTTRHVDTSTPTDHRLGAAMDRSRRAAAHASNAGRQVNRA
jgi:hypothetical protein